MRVTSVIHIPAPSIPMQSLREFQSRPTPALPDVPVVKPLEHLHELSHCIEATHDLLQQRETGKSVKAAECIKAYTHALRMGSHA